MSAPASLFPDHPHGWIRDRLRHTVGTLRGWPRASDDQLRRDLDDDDAGRPRDSRAPLLHALGRIEGAAERVLLARENGGDLDHYLRQLADVLLDVETLEERDARRDHIRRCRVTP